MKLFIKYNEQRLAKEGDSKILTREVIQVGKTNLFVEQRFVYGKPNKRKIEDCRVYKIENNEIEVGIYKKSKGGFVKSSLWTNGKSIFDKS